MKWLIAIILAGLILFSGCPTTDFTDDDYYRIAIENNDPFICEGINDVSQKQECLLELENPTTEPILQEQVSEPEPKCNPAICEAKNGSYCEGTTKVIETFYCKNDECVSETAREENSVECGYKTDKELLQEKYPDKTIIGRSLAIELGEAATYSRWSRTAKEGWKWFVAEVTITNLGKKAECINSLSGSFNLKDDEDRRFSVQHYYLLDKGCLAPTEVSDYNLVFEIPETMNKERLYYSDGYSDEPEDYIITYTTIE
ncbi:MAG: DUF4352 domain-containing protein [Candidatus Diapherotrites archaeon]